MPSPVFFNFVVIATTILPILGVRELRQQEVKQLARGLTARYGRDEIQSQVEDAKVNALHTSLPAMNTQK